MAAILWHNVIQITCIRKLSVLLVINLNPAAENKRAGNPKSSLLLFQGCAKSHHSWNPEREKGLKKPHIVYSLGCLNGGGSLCKFLLPSWIPFVHVSARGIAALCEQVSQKLSRQWSHHGHYPEYPKHEEESWEETSLDSSQEATGKEVKWNLCQAGSPALGMVPEKGQETRAGHTCAREGHTSMRPLSWGVRLRPIQQAGLETWQLSAGLKSGNLLMSLSHQQGH